MSHRYLLDTNVLAELARDPAGPAARAIAAAGERAVCTSVIVACEVHYGLAKRASPKLTDRMFEILATIDVLTNLPEDIGVHYGRIRAHVASVLDYLRRKRILHDPEHEIFTKYWMEGDRKIQQGYLPSFLAPNGTKLRRDATEKPSLVTQWLSVGGDTTMRQIARKWGVAAEAVESFLERLFDFLVDCGLLVPVRLKGARGRPLPNVHGVYQVNADQLRLNPNRGVQRCRSCRRTTIREVPHDRCPAWRCNGVLEWVREDEDNYDLQLLDGAYSMLRPEEHTAVVPQTESERLENLFKGASDAVKCLVCTPTLEFGIDSRQLG